MKWIWFAIIVLPIAIACLTVPDCYGQKMIRLSKHTRQTFLIVEGERIRCKLTDGTRLLGIAGNITDSTLTIDGTRIDLEDVAALAKKKKGSNLFVGMVIGVSAGLIFTGSIHSRSELYLVGVAASLLLIKPLYGRKWKDVKTKWDLEVVDVAGKSPVTNTKP